MSNSKDQPGRIVFDLSYASTQWTFGKNADLDTSPTWVQK